MDLMGLMGRHSARRAELERRRAALFRLAYLWCHDRALADDLVQEALTKAVQRLAQLRDPSKFDSWLYGILVNCWRDHLRQRRPEENIDAVEEHGLAHEDTPERAAGLSELAARVHAAVELLPIGQREVLSLVDLQECSYAEAAEILSIPVGTVMSRLARGRAALRASLAETRPADTRPALRTVK